MHTFRCSANLFDLDGVLVNSIAAVERAWLKFAARHNLDPDLVIRTAHGHRSIETVRMLTAHLDAEAEKVIVEQDKINDTEGITPTEGAVELLAILPAERWGIVTSGTRPLAVRRLQAAGLAQPAILVTASEVSNGKPHPEPYLKGAEAAGFPPEGCLVFEDAPSGIRSAQAAAMKVIGIPATFPAAELRQSDALVRSLAHVSVEVRKDGLSVRLPEFATKV